MLFRLIICLLVLVCLILLFWKIFRSKRVKNLAKDTMNIHHEEITPSDILNEIDEQEKRLSRLLKDNKKAISEIENTNKKIEDYFSAKKNNNSETK